MTSTNPASTALGEVARQKLLPVLTHLKRDLRVSVPRQVREQRAGSQTEEVDMLSAPGRLADERKPRMVCQRVDRRRLAGIGSSRESHLGRSIHGQLRPVCRSGQKFSVLKRVRSARAPA